MPANTDCILFGDDWMLLLLQGRPSGSCFNVVSSALALYELDEGEDSAMLLEEFKFVAMLESWVDEFSKFVSHKTPQFLPTSGRTLD